MRTAKRRHDRTVRAVLVCSGDPSPVDARWLDGAELVVAVDGGAAWLSSIGQQPELLIGDLDSVDAELIRRLEAASVTVEPHATEKDSSDLELAVASALRRGADEIVVLGAFGGERLDHEIANVLLLAGERQGGSATGMRLVRGGTAVRVLRGDGELSIEASIGSLVTLLSLGQVAKGITTTGLRYPLRDETLHLGSSRGLSNEVSEAQASVRLRHGALLIIEAEREEPEK
jgi:thiamine pyrophosphokinase